MRFLKEFVYTGEEKETLDNHKRKMVLRCAILKSRTKRRFSFYSVEKAIGKR